MFTPGDRLHAEMEQARKDRERSKPRKFLIGLGWTLLIIAATAVMAYLGAMAGDSVSN
jgi:hypothetical protein